MKTSEKVDLLFKAQVAMQAEMKNIAKDSKGYGYNYTSLEKLIEHVRPVLAKHKLGFIQTNTSKESGDVGVTTRLIHESGQWVEDTMTAPLYKLAKMNEYQVAGSVITYFRRYALASIIGVASDEDMDAQGEVQAVNYERPTASQATAEDKKRTWQEFRDACQVQEVDAVEFLEWTGTDMADKAKVHNVVNKFLKSGQMLADQLLTYKHREN